MVKKILSIALWIVTGAALVTLFIFGRKWHLETTLKDIQVTIEQPQATGFINNDSLTSLIWTLYDVGNQTTDSTDMYQQPTIASIDMTKLRQMLDKNPWIAYSRAYIDLNDTMYVTVKEYDPVVRVYNNDGYSVYVTRNGFVIPTSPHYTPHLIIASGNYNFDTLTRPSNIADTIYQNTGLAEALALAKAIEKDKFLKENIGQIYKNTNNEYEVIVNNLPIQVILGDTCAVYNKLQRLKIMLEKYNGTVEIDDYKTMNLKYKNQIVCTKK